MLSYHFQTFQRTEGKGLSTDISKAQRCLRSRGSSSRRSPKKMCIVVGRSTAMLRTPRLRTNGMQAKPFLHMGQAKEGWHSFQGSQSRSVYGWFVVQCCARTSTCSFLLLRLLPAKTAYPGELTSPCTVPSEHAEEPLLCGQ